MRTEQEIQDAVNAVFEQYPGTLNMPFLVASSLRNLNVTPEEYSEAKDQVIKWVWSQSQHGNFTVKKGQNGGIMRGATPMPEHSVEAAKNVVTEAVNDFVCPTCGNTHCSIMEKLCWKCGNPLH